MKKHQLLEEAMRRFPAGTKFWWVQGVEHISSGVFEFVGDRIIIVVGIEHEGEEVYIYNEGWAEPVKPSILSGRVAIQVNNEREFKLLMKHYESKGWKWRYGGKVDINDTEYDLPTIADYHDDFQVNSDIENPGEYNVVQFPDFAAEVGITVPKFIMKSEDSVDLYEGDKYTGVWYEGVRWEIAARSAYLYDTNAVVTHPETCKAFSTREAAEKWIDEQNKPKEITVELHGGYKVRVDKEKATFAINCFAISSAELEEIWKAYQSLKGPDLL